jgi:hypothetical protein
MLGGGCLAASHFECAPCGGASSSPFCRSGTCDHEEFTTIERLEGAGLPGTFTVSGAGAWTPSATVSPEGAQCLASPSIRHRQSASVSRRVFVGGKLQVTFALRISSETVSAGHSGDALVFSVDGFEVCRWTGTTLWESYTHVLTDGGEHLLSWTYATSQTQSHPELDPRSDRGAIHAPRSVRDAITSGTSIQAAVSTC